MGYNGVIYQQLLSFTYTPENNQKDGLISPKINLPLSNELFLTFDIAYQKEIILILNDTLKYLCQQIVVLHMIILFMKNMVLIQLLILHRMILCQNITH